LRKLIRGKHINEEGMHRNVFPHFSFSGSFPSLLGLGNRSLKKFEGNKGNEGKSLREKGKGWFSLNV
jgi:hypothetical protein